MGTKKAPGEGRAERKKRETRQKIIKAAMDLIQRQGFDNTTMEQIAEEADIARKTLYNHFPVKEAIVDQYVRERSAELSQKTLNNLIKLPDTRSRLLAALDNAYEWVEVNPEITGICLGYRLQNTCKGSEYSDNPTGTQSTLTEIIRLGHESGELRQDASPNLLLTQIEVLRGAVVLNWLKDQSKFELRKEMARIVDLFLYGAINRKDS